MTNKKSIDNNIKCSSKKKHFDKANQEKNVNPIKVFWLQLCSTKSKTRQTYLKKSSNTTTIKFNRFNIQKSVYVQ